MKKSILVVSLLLSAMAGYSQEHANASIIAKADENNSTATMSATPRYPGGDHAFLYFINTNIKYPRLAREEKTQGTVTVRFTVDADGNVKHAMVPKGQGIGNGCDEEAVRVVMSSPAWKPGLRNGIPSSIWYEVPIVFALTPSR